MTAKEYLRQVYKLDRRIRITIGKAEKLREMLEYSPPSAEGSGGGSTADRMPDMISKIMEYERKATELKAKYIDIFLDAEKGMVKTKGWVADCGLKVDEVLPGILDAGASFVVYTDIERDGMQSGVNVEALKHLCEICSVPVLVAGGVATLDDVKRLYPLSVDGGLEGAISGRALYEKTLDLKEANAWIAAQQA